MGILVPVAGATNQYWPGATCMFTGYNTPSYEQYAGSVRGPYGNSQSLGSGLVCPLAGTTLSSGGAIGSWVIRFHDRSTDTLTSSTGSVFCSPTARNSAGTTWILTTKYSCSTAGGCTTPNNAYTGANYLEWTNPFGTSAVDTFYADCYLPNGGTNNYSQLFSQKLFF
jgi:hypothetical protein